MGLHDREKVLDGGSGGASHKPGFVVPSHFSGPLLAKGNERSYPGVGGPPHPPLFDLAPDGACRSPTVTRWLVGPYPTFSPLPVGGLISVALSLGLRPLEFLQHPALRSPDFPLPWRQRLGRMLPREQYRESFPSVQRWSLAGEPLHSVEWQEQTVQDEGRGCRVHRRKGLPRTT